MLSAGRAARLRLVPKQRSDPEASPLSKSDEEVLRALEAGDTDRAGILYDALVGTVEATLFRVLGKRGEDHDDLVQVCFEQILLTLKKRRFAKACSLKSWAAAISTNVALNALRSTIMRRKYFDLKADPTPSLAHSRLSDDPERTVAVRGQVELLREQLSTLSEEQAQTLILHDALGYELSEIAVLMGATLSASQSRLVRGRKKLKQRLSDAGVIGEATQ